MALPPCRPRANCLLCRPGRHPRRCCNRSCRDCRRGKKFGRPRSATHLVPAGTNGGSRHGNAPETDPGIPSRSPTIPWTSQSEHWNNHPHDAPHYCLCSHRRRHRPPRAARTTAAECACSSGRSSAAQHSAVPCSTSAIHLRSVRPNTHHGRTVVAAQREPECAVRTDRAEAVSRVCRACLRGNQRVSSYRTRILHDLLRVPPHFMFHLTSNEFVQWGSFIPILEIT